MRRLFILSALILIGALSTIVVSVSATAPQIDDDLYYDTTWDYILWLDTSELDPVSGMPFCYTGTWSNVFLRVNRSGTGALVDDPEFKLNFEVYEVYPEDLYYEAWEDYFTVEDYPLNQDSIEYLGFYFPARSTATVAVRVADNASNTIVFTLSQDDPDFYVYDWSYFCDELLATIKIRDGLIPEPGAEYQAGYNAGYNTGYSVGRQVGVTTGYNDGYNDGEIDGVEIGRDLGYQQGYIVGYNAGREFGYQQGYDQGIADEFDGFSWIRGFLVDVVGGFLSIEIFPSITIGLAVGVPFTLALAAWIIGLIRGRTKGGDDD